MSIKCPKCYTDDPDTQKFCVDCGTQLIPANESQPSFAKILETPVEELSSRAYASMTSVFFL
jgi:hypothetical protein